MAQLGERFIRIEEVGGSIPPSSIKRLEVDRLRAFSVREAGKIDGRHRRDIRIGSRVAIVRKEDQGSGKLTYGVVKGILTPSASHPHGIKVRLEDGSIGRVKQIDSSPENGNGRRG